MIPNFNARTISVQSPVFKSSDWGTPYILFHSLKGSENINELFEYVVQVRAQDEEGQGIVERYISKAESLAGGAPGSNLDLKSTIGSNLTISIELDGKRLGVWGESIERQAGGILDSARGAGVRHINGIITKAAHLGSLGRYPLYEFTIRNWMWLLTQSSDYKVWQKVSIPDIIRAVLSTLPYKVDYRLTKTYPSMDYIVQYSESHYHFIKRLMESVGISFFVDHQKDGHTVVITDALSGFKPMDSVAYQECHVHPAGLKLAEEYISRLEPLQQHVTGQIRLNDHQFKQPKADQTSTSSQPWETAHNALEHYEWQQGGYLSADEGGKDKAQVYMEAIRQHGHRAIAAGNLRGIQSGHSLFIRNSTHEDANRGWIVLGTTLHATETSQETHSDSKYSIHVEFTLHPDNEQVRPDRRLNKPEARTQTAIVVGPKDKEVWVDQYGRVKVQFHWDRYGASDENSSCWVRVSSPWQGTNFGGIQHPRIGQEVIIDFLSADPDMPFVSGRLSNPDTMPNWELPSQHALSGFKSKEIDGAQNNHLIMDDTPKEVQVQLTSDHQLSQLNLGYITRIPDVKGRADYRGQGFELRSDGWGAIRSAKGMMLSTYTRATGTSHVKDMSEIVGVLKTAHNQHHSFAELAIDHKADERSIDDTAQAELLNQNHDISGEAHPKDKANAAIAKAQAMTAPDPKTGASWKVKGEGDESKDAQSATATDKDKFPELKQPHLVLGSPAGIELATPKSVHIATSEHTAITTGQDLSLSVGKRLAASVSKGISFFTQTLGMKLFAAKGKVEIQAQSDNIEIIADKVMKLISAKESIEIAAKKEVLITSGGSYIRINAGGIEHGTLGFWKAHAGSHNLPGEKGLDYASPKMPKPAFSNRLDLYDILAGRDFSQIKYTAILDDKTVSSGTFDEHGRTARIFSNKQQNAKLLVSTGDNWAYSVKTEATLTNSIQFELKDFMGDPIKDLRYEFRTNGSVVKAGQFNGDKVNVTTSGTGVLELWVEKFPTQTLGLALNMTDIAGISEVSLISPKKVYKFELLPDGEKGDYWRGTYEVQDGETFASIAEKYGTTPISLLAMNSDIDDYSKPVYPALTKGQVIQVPPQSNRKS